MVVALALQQKGHLSKIVVVVISVCGPSMGHAINHWIEYFGKIYIHGGNVTCSDSAQLLFQTTVWETPVKETLTWIISSIKLTTVQRTLRSP